MRALQFSLTAAWTLAYTAGVGLVLIAAIRLSAQYHQKELDSELALHAMAVYGLAWVDNDGNFHGEYFRREPLLLNSPFDIWAIGPGDPPTIHLQPKTPRLDVPALGSIAQRVVRTDANLELDGEDLHGEPYRLHAIPSYDDNDVARMAIIVAGEAAPSRAAHRKFVRQIGASAAAISLMGIAVGTWLARRSLRPLALAYQQRERFLSGAAHELRNPIASLRAVCESAAAGDDPPDRALARIAPIVRRTGEMVEDLLLYARIESGGAALAGGDLRLDLLAESCLPEDGSIDFEAEESVVRADAALLRVAITNLLRNAASHARRRRGDVRIALIVRGSRVVVEDNGPGFPEDLLRDAAEPFVSSNESRGVGLGLALARLIAEVHGGGLCVENRPEGGARVTLTLA